MYLKSNLKASSSRYFNCNENVSYFDKKTEVVSFNEKVVKVIIQNASIIKNKGILR